MSNLKEDTSTTRPQHDPNTTSTTSGSRMPRREGLWRRNRDSSTALPLSWVEPGCGGSSASCLSITTAPTAGSHSNTKRTGASKCKGWMPFMWYTPTTSRRDCFSELTVSISTHLAALAHVFIWGSGFLPPIVKTHFTTKRPFLTIRKQSFSDAM